MKVKLQAFLFLILLSMFFTNSVLQTVDGLTKRTDFSNRHSTASSGYSSVCGDHLCNPEERYDGLHKKTSLQNGSQVKVNSPNSGIIWHNICGGVRC